MILLAGFVGYELGVGIMTWIGFQPGFIPFLVGLAVALAHGGVGGGAALPEGPHHRPHRVCWRRRDLGRLLPRVRSHLAGGLQFGAVGAIVRDSWIWGMLYLALAGVGILIQWGTTEHYVHDAADANQQRLRPPQVRSLQSRLRRTALQLQDSSTATAPVTDRSANGASLADASTSDTPVSDAPADA